MATASDKPHLGMDNEKRPAEMALYLSILKEGGFHGETSAGWMFQVPTPENDKCNLLPSLTLITETLASKGIDALVPVTEVFRALSLSSVWCSRGTSAVHSRHLSCNTPPACCALRGWHLSTQRSRGCVFEDYEGA